MLVMCLNTRLFRLSYRVFPAFFIHLYIKGAKARIYLCLGMLMNTIYVRLKDLSRFFICNFYPIISTFAISTQGNYRCGRRRQSCWGVSCLRACSSIVCLYVVLCVRKNYTTGLHCFLYASSVAHEGFPPRVEQVFSSLCLSGDDQHMGFVGSSTRTRPIVPPSPSGSIPVPAYSVPVAFAV